MNTVEYEYTEVQMPVRVTGQITALIPTLLWWGEVGHNIDRCISSLRLAPISVPSLVPMPQLPVLQARRGLGTEAGCNYFASSSCIDSYSAVVHQRGYT